MDKGQNQPQRGYSEKGQVSSVPPKGPNTSSVNPGGGSPASQPPPAAPTTPKAPSK